MFSLYFAHDEFYTRQLGDGTIAIWPVDRGWNDFGYGFQAEARIRVQANVDFRFQLFVVPWQGFLQSHRFNIWSENYLQDRRLAAVEPHMASHFYSVMRGNGYKDFMEWCDGNEEVRDSVLFLIRDIVYFRWRDIERNNMRLFLQDESVATGVFRDESAFLAVHRAWRILAGFSNSEVDDSRQPFDFICHLSGFIGAHECSFTFNAPALLSDRCHALIGRNGIGKSRLLRELVLHLATLSLHQTSAFVDNDVSDAISVHSSFSHQQFNRIVVMTWDSESAFPSASRLDAPFEYLMFQMAGGAHEQHDNLAPVDESDLLTAMLVQVLRDRSVDRDRFDTLSRVLHSVIDINSLAVRLRVDLRDGGQKIQWIRLQELYRNNEQKKLELLGRIDPSTSPMLMHEEYPIPLSSGERSFLTFAIRVVASLTQGSLLILDEPETHLHPNLIADMMQVLQPLLVEIKSIAIAATHSPFVVRELPSDCVHMVSLDENEMPTVRHAYLRTLGASVDRLSIDIFGDALQSKHHVFLAKKIAVDCESIEQAIEIYGSEVSSEMLSLVRYFMDRPNASS